MVVEVIERPGTVPVDEQRHPEPSAMVVTKVKSRKSSRDASRVIFRRVLSNYSHDRVDSIGFLITVVYDDATSFGVSFSWRAGKPLDYKEVASARRAPDQIARQRDPVRPRSITRTARGRTSPDW